MSDKLEPMNEMEQNETADCVESNERVKTGEPVETKNDGEPVEAETNAGMNRESVYDSSEFRQQIENGGYQESPKEAEARKQAEREKAKFEQKQEKARKKAEKKAIKKAAKKEKGHGIVFKTASFVIAAAAFGVIALGTMYFVGDELGIIDRGSSNAGTISSTQVGAANKDILNKDKESETTAINTNKTNSSQSGIVAVDVSPIVEEVMPSIVSITSKTIVQSGMNDWFYNYYFGDQNGGSYEQTGAGSGIIIGQNDTELLVITNNHVVDGADSLQVQFIDGTFVDAVIKGTEANKDLAVVAIKLSDIDSDTKNKIKVATLGDSDSMKVGEGTIAIGNALGYGQSVTVGVISALDREVTVENRTMNMIQTDAAINKGNSGGALLNMRGEVIGINAAKYSSDTVEGMGFAIPVSSVSDIIEKLMNRETLTKVDVADRGYLNIRGRDVTDELANDFNAPKGVLIREIIEGGAADKAGLEKSQIITKINDDDVKSMEELKELLEYYEKGTTVTLTIQYLENKEYKEKEVKVVLGGQME